MPGIMSPLTSAGTPNANMAQFALFINSIPPPSEVHAPKTEIKPCLRNNNNNNNNNNSNNHLATQRLSRKRAVIFAPNVTMKVIPHKTSLPSNKIWYSLNEQKQLLKETMDAARLRRHFMSMSEHDFEETHNESVRGIEHYLSKRLYKTLKEEQDTVITTVPLFQEKMKAKGLPIDHEALSRVSQVLSAPARERAYQKGLQHACSSRPSHDMCGHTAAQFQSQFHHRQEP